MNKPVTRFYTKDEIGIEVELNKTYPEDMDMDETPMIDLIISDFLRFLESSEYDMDMVKERILLQLVEKN